MQLKKRESIFRGKLSFTVLILLVYMIGRYIPLYGVDTQAYAGSVMGAEEVLTQVIGGDTYQHSLFALGVSPYIIASLLIQVVMLCMGKSFRERVSPRKMHRAEISLMFVFALLQAVGHVGELRFAAAGDILNFVRLMAMLEMVTGAMVILMLCNMNKKYGIGGQIVLIIFNIAAGVQTNIKGCAPDKLPLMIALSFAVAIVIIVMENTEKRIPLQRVSIHNIYADKNYLAIKYNPIGVMPVMFSTAFFTLPKLLVNLLSLLFPYNQALIWWEDNLNLTRPLGIIIYLIVVYLITIGFSFLMLSPKDTMEQFLKSGDSILNIHAGKDTRRYLRRNILHISFFSATVMSICLGASLLLQLGGNMEGTPSMLPSSAMLLAGMSCNFAREVVATRTYDDYQHFILTA